MGDRKCSRPRPDTVLTEPLDQYLFIKDILLFLNDAERTMLRLKYWLGFSNEELAELYDVPLTTIEGRSRLLMHKLRLITKDVYSENETPRNYFN